MLRSFIGVLTLCALGSAWLSAKPPEQEKSSAKVIALDIHKQLPGELQQEFGAYNSGVRIYAMFTLPGKKVLAVDSEASTLTAFTDDKGNDLTKPAKKDDYPPAWLNKYDLGVVSKDRKNFALNFNGAAAPAEAATKVILKAKLAVLCGTDEKTVETKNVELKAGKNTKMGALVVSYDKDNSYDKSTAVVFVCEDAPRVKSVTFFDKDEQVLQANQGGYRRSNTVGRSDWICTYYITSKVDEVTVRVTYFEKVETVTVPVDLSVGVGL